MQTGHERNHEAVTKYTEKQPKKQPSGVEWPACSNLRSFSPTMGESPTAFNAWLATKSQNLCFGCYRETNTEERDRRKRKAIRPSATRAIQITTGLHPYQRRLRDRARQRVAFSLCCWPIWRCSIRAVLPGIPCYPGRTDLGHGACGWSREQEIGCPSIRPSRAARNEVALV